MSASPLDCQIEPFTQGLEQWLYSGDAFVVGTVESVRPALDIGWVSDRAAGGERLKDAAACQAIESGFVIELSHSTSVQADATKDLISEIYVGFDQYNAWDNVPQLQNGRVRWPASSGGTIEEGMQIASLLRQEATTGRWGVPIAFGEPLFLVRDGLLQAQTGAGNQCGPNVPLGELNGQSVDSIIKKLSGYAQSPAYSAAIDARRAQQDASDAAALVAPGTWFAHCAVPSSIKIGADCQTDADCLPPGLCADGYCVHDVE